MLKLDLPICCIIFCLGWYRRGMMRTHASNCIHTSYGGTRKNMENHTYIVSYTDMENMYMQTYAEICRLCLTESQVLPSRQACSFHHFLLALLVSSSAHRSGFPGIRAGDTETSFHKSCCLMLSFAFSAVEVHSIWVSH